MSAPTETTIDTGALETLAEIGGEEFAVSMVQTFDDVAAANLDAIRAAAERGEASVVRRACHALRSSASQLGATVLAEQLAHGEASTPASIDGLRELAADLDALHGAAMRALRAWCETRTRCEADGAL